LWADVVVRMIFRMIVIHQDLRGVRMIGIRPTSKLYVMVMLVSLLLLALVSRSFSLYTPCFSYIIVAIPLFADYHKDTFFSLTITVY